MFQFVQMAVRCKDGVWVHVYQCERERYFACVHSFLFFFPWGRFMRTLVKGDAAILMLKVLVVFVSLPLLHTHTSDRWVRSKAEIFNPDVLPEWTRDRFFSKPLWHCPNPSSQQKTRSFQCLGGMNHFPAPDKMPSPLRTFLLHYRSFPVHEAAF